MDGFDRAIISALQKRGRLTNMEVAKKVGLSHSACSRRIARLEQEGVITGYRALTDRKRLGLSIRAFCGVIRHQDVHWEVLGQNLAKIPGVVSVFAVTGEADIMLEIVAQDMDEFSQVILREVLKHEGVVATRSAFVLEEIRSLY